jgi:choline-sulfatase
MTLRSAVQCGAMGVWIVASLIGCSAERKTELPQPGPIRAPWLDVKGAGGPWNIVLLTLDTVRSDRLGCYGNKDGITPRLDALAARGVLFEQAITPIPVTLPSHTTMLTGLNPQVHGVRNNGTFVLDPKHVTLAELLKEQGYATGATLGAIPLERRYGLDQGFDTYDDAFAPTSNTQEQQQRTADQITDLTLQWIRGHLDKSPNQPFFHWSHYYDAHFPYVPPEPYRSRFAHPYDGEIGFVDAEIGRLLDGLEALDLMRRTWIVVVADHGEALGEHGETYHSVLLYRATQDVPLIMVPPGEWKGLPDADLRGRRVNQVVSLQDIAPTLVNALGLPEDKTLGKGISLLDLLAGRSEGPVVAYMETLVPYLEYDWCELRGVRMNGWTYIRAPERELYNIASDPKEAKNVYAKNAEIAGKLEAWCAYFSDEETELKMQQPDQQTVERLRSLGYVGNATPSGSPVNDKDPKHLMDVYQQLLNARSALEANNPPAARTILDSALRQDPGNPEATRLLGSTLMTLGQPAEAAKAYEALRKRYPGTVQYVIDLAYCRLRTGRVKEGADLLEEVLRMNPSEPVAIELYPRALAASGREEDARRFLRGRIDTSDQPAKAMVALAQLEWERNRHREANEAAESAIKVDPKVPGAHTIMGLWWWEQAMRQATPDGRNIDDDALGRARKHLDQAMALNPNDPQAGSRLALLLQRENKTQEALDLLVRIAKANESNPMSQFEAGKALHVAGRAGDAIPFYDAALRLGYAEPNFLTNYGLACAAVGDRARAVELLRRALSMNPDPGLTQTIRKNLAILGQ